jgi:hypothetical protein
MGREETDEPIKGKSGLFFLGRLQHGNSLDRSIGALSARWWRLGIFALAPLAPLPIGTHTCWLTLFAEFLGGSILAINPMGW